MDVTPSSLQLLNMNYFLSSLRFVIVLTSVGVMPFFSVWVRYLVDRSKRPVRCPPFTSSGLFSACGDRSLKKDKRGSVPT